MTREPSGPSTSARPSPSPGGWPGDVTMAGSRSSTCARPAGCPGGHPGRGRRPQPAQRALPESHRRGQQATRGQREPHLPSGEVEVTPQRTMASRCSAPAWCCCSPSTTTSRWARSPGSSIATSTCVARGRPTRSACGAGSPGCPRRTRRPDSVEIETPTLTRSTPEGARDFLVRRGSSRGAGRPAAEPQLFKQLLMVAGMERDYQIARRYRTRISGRPPAGVHPAGRRGASSTRTT